MLFVQPGREECKADSNVWLALFGQGSLSLLLEFLGGRVFIEHLRQ